MFLKFSNLKHVDIEQLKDYNLTINKADCLIGLYMAYNISIIAAVIYFNSPYFKMFCCGKYSRKKIKAYKKVCFLINFKGRAFFLRKIQFKDMEVPR